MPKGLKGFQKGHKMFSNIGDIMKGKPAYWKGKKRGKMSNETKKKISEKKGNS